MEQARWDRVLHAEEDLALRRYRRHHPKRVPFQDPRNRHELVALAKVYSGARDRAVHETKRQAYEFRSRFAGAGAAAGTGAAAGAGAAAGMLFPFLLPSLTPTLSSHSTYLRHVTQAMDKQGTTVAPGFPLTMIVRDLVLEACFADSMQSMYSKDGFEGFNPAPMALSFPVLTKVAASQGLDAVVDHLTQHVYTPVADCRETLHCWQDVAVYKMLRAIALYDCALREDLDHPEVVRCANLVPDLVHAALQFHVHGWGCILPLKHSCWWSAYLDFSDRMLQKAYDLCSKHGLLGFETTTVRFRLQTALCSPTLAAKWWPDLLQPPHFEFLVSELARLRLKDYHYKFFVLQTLVPASQARLLPWIVDLSAFGRPPPADRMPPGVGHAIQAHIAAARAFIASAEPLFDSGHVSAAVAPTLSMSTGVDVGIAPYDRWVESMQRAAHTLFHTGRLDPDALEAVQQRFRPAIMDARQKRKSKLYVPALHAHALVHYLQETRPHEALTSGGLLGLMYRADREALASSSSAASASPPVCPLCRQATFSVADYVWASTVRDVVDTEWQMVHITVRKVHKVATVNFAAALRLWEAYLDVWLQQHAVPFVLRLVGSMTKRHISPRHVSATFLDVLRHLSPVAMASVPAYLECFDAIAIALSWRLLSQEAQLEWRRRVPKDGPKVAGATDCRVPKTKVLVAAAEAAAEDAMDDVLDMFGRMHVKAQ